MGYCADLVSGVDIVIVSPPAVVNAVAEWEMEMSEVDKPSNYPPVHMSWCSTVDHYRALYSDDAQLVLVAMLEDYGFNAEVSENGYVVVDSWGGDKIGSTFLEMFKCLSKGTRTNVDWMFRGEDGEYFAMCIRGTTTEQPGDAWEYAVQVEYKIIKDRYANDGADY